MQVKDIGAKKVDPPATNYGRVRDETRDVFVDRYRERFGAQRPTRTKARNEIATWVQELVGGPEVGAEEIAEYVDGFLRGCCGGDGVSGNPVARWHGWQDGIYTHKALTGHLYSWQMRGA